MKTPSREMTFGKHAGVTLEYIAVNDPGYVFWLQRKNIVDVPQHVTELAKKHRLRDIEPDFEDLHPDWGIR